MLAVVLLIGVPTISYGQGPPPLEDGESQIYGERDITDDVIEIGGVIVDGIKSFFKWICFWCDD